MGDQEEKRKLRLERLTEAANRHLYAGELLYKIAVAIDDGARRLTDPGEAIARLRVRQLLLDYAEGELLVTHSLCHVAEQDGGELKLDRRWS